MIKDVGSDNTMWYIGCGYHLVVKVNIGIYNIVQCTMYNVHVH